MPAVRDRSKTRSRQKIKSPIETVLGNLMRIRLPLFTQGADSPSNMQWQTVVDAKTKDRAERKLCRRQ